MRNSERLNWIDLSKGLGIILVVYGHVARGLNSAGIGFDAYRQIDNAIYAFHMPLFFLLAGFFFVKSAQKGLLNYMKSKTATILYPYLIWSLIQIVIQFFASNYTNGKIDIHEVYTFFIPRGQFWFLLALFFISLINIILYSKLGKKGLIISSVISLIYILIKPEIEILSETINNLLFFNIGVYLFEDQSFRKQVVSGTLVLWLNIVLFIGLEYLLLKKLFDSSVFDLIIAISGSLFIIQIFNLKNMNFKHLKEIGRQSMIIYLLHILAASGTRIVLVKIFKVDNIYIHIIIGTLFGVYMPFLIYKLGLIKKISFLFKLQITNNKLLTTIKL